ncbi:hypothetical protein T12_1619 [Trichinella patagoniensis]|uniref:Uncharacterized protein n=1 Tax=Trichinella patagoniensis TaxID=990121 RepID=A0A0V0ZRM0_9BILA|nr:hypothetical protein T12_1619 [Trichinella patagoniensis]
MDIPNRNFSGRKPLSLEVLEQGFHLTRPKPVDLPKHSLAKVEEPTLNPGVGKVALKSRDQGYFEIANKLRQVLPLWNGALKHSATHGQIFPNSQTIYDG